MRHQLKPNMIHLLLDGNGVYGHHLYVPKNENSPIIKNLVDNLSMWHGYTNSNDNFRIAEFTDDNATEIMLHLDKMNCNFSLGGEFLD